jgi:hypothetical protein
MHTNIVEVQKVVLIRAEFIAAGVYKQDIYIPFKADIVIVRQLSAFEATVDDILSIHASFLDDPIGTFALKGSTNVLDTINATPNTHITVAREPKGSCTFTVRSSSGSEAAITGGVYLILEFVKYKEVK